MQRDTKTKLGIICGPSARVREHDRDSISLSFEGITCWRMGCRARYDSQKKKIIVQCAYFFYRPYINTSMSIVSSGGLGFNAPRLFEKTSAMNRSMGSPAHPPKQVVASKPVLISDLADVKEPVLLKSEVKTLNTVLSTDRAHMRERLSKLNSKADSIHDASQVVYARARADLYGTDEAGDALTDDAPMIASKNGLIAFVYPMKQVNVEDTVRYWMRAKIVHPNTGQIQYKWVNIVDMVGGKVTKRRIGEFKAIPA